VVKLIGTRGEQRGAFALEHRVRLDRDEDVEVARRRAERAGLALARQADAGAVVDPGGDFDVELLHPVDAPFAAALAARALDHLAAAVARRARLLDDEEAPAARGPCRGPCTARSGAARCPGSAPDPAHGLARHRNFDLELDRLAVERVLEADLQVVAQVGPAPRGRARRRPNALPKIVSKMSPMSPKSGCWPPPLPWANAA
jgi:hypothetical protein